MSMARLMEQVSTFYYTEPLYWQYIYVSIIGNVDKSLLNIVKELTCSDGYLTLNCLL